MLVVAILFSICGLVQLAPIMEQGPIEAIPSGNEAHFKDMDGVDGTYVFGYDTGVGKAQSYRYENRTADGKVFGKYGYIAPDGILREVHYIADNKGYRTFLINRYPVKMERQPSFIGPIPSRLNFT